MSVERPPSSPPVPSMDVGRPRMAHAVQRGPSDRLVWSAVLKDALDRHYGSLKAAAYAMGQYDPSQLTRDLETGKFKQERLELCDDAAKAAIASALYAAFGDADPKAQRRRLWRNLHRAIEELEIAEAVA
jgi:hypothetical protein